MSKQSKAKQNKPSNAQSCCMARTRRRKGAAEEDRRLAPLMGYSTLRSTVDLTSTGQDGARASRWSANSDQTTRTGGVWPGRQACVGGEGEGAAAHCQGLLLTCKTCSLEQGDNEAARVSKVLIRHLPASKYRAKMSTSQAIGYRAS